MSTSNLECFTWDSGYILLDSIDITWDLTCIVRPGKIHIDGVSDFLVNLYRRSNFTELDLELVSNFNPDIEGISDLTQLIELISDFKSTKMKT